MSPLRCIPLVVVVLVTGCLGQASEQESPQEEWEARTGAACDEFAHAYDAGWAVGCRAAVASLSGEERASLVTGCGHPASAEDMLLPPGEPPLSPATEGYMLGVADGCEEAYENAGRDPDSCSLRG